MDHFKNSGRKANGIIFLSVILLGGVLFFLLPKKAISEREKRSLASFPKFSYNNLISGQFADSIDLYFSDNFVFRDEIINIASVIREHTGWRDDEIRVYGGTDFESQISNTKEEVDEGDLDVLLPLDSNHTGNDPTAEENSDPGKYSKVNSVIVYRKKAIQMYKGSNGAVKRYADLMGKYYQTFDGKVNIYCMPIPIGADFYLPDNFSHTNEKETIDYLYSVLPSGVKAVHAYEALEKHRDEYLYFNTDHHWTGRGAFYAYQSFCRSAGLEPIAPERLTRKVIKNFLGTLYALTLSKELKENIDSVEYFKLPFETKAIAYPKGSDKPRAANMLIEGARGGHAYGVFLGADYPLMKITSNVKNGRKILEVKDSYGNAFAPFLPANFEEVFVVDYRYYEGNIKDLVKQYGITDIIFAHNVYVVNSAFTIKRESFLIR
jgi:DHHW protein